MGFCGSVPGGESAAMRLTGLFSTLLVVSVTVSAANNAYDDREIIERLQSSSNKLLALLPQRNEIGYDRRSLTNKDLTSELNELKAILRSIQGTLWKQKDANAEIIQHRNTLKGHIEKLLDEVAEYKKLGLALYTLKQGLDRMLSAKPSGG